MATTVEPSPIPEKFSNLPAEDLDTTGPDVFETADVPGALNPEVRFVLLSAGGSGSRCLYRNRTMKTMSLV